MLLKITSTTAPATDLGYLLHKNPARPQTFQLPFGNAHVFYPEATSERCTAALVLDIDPIGLIRGRRGPAGATFSIDHYVNDRPYVASSFLSVSIAQVYGSALSGRSKERPELAERALPWEVEISVLPCRGGEGYLRELFEPLGYAVSARRIPLDERFPEWGESPYFVVGLRGERPLHELLSHIYVLIPVLDNEKHYWVGEEELEKLLKHGEGWLNAHPKRESIVERYLKHFRRLTREALARLSDENEADPDASADEHSREEEAVEEKISLNQQRLGSVLAALKASGARRVLDLGCGEGRLLRLLLDERQFEEIVGVDASWRALQIASERLRLDRMPDAKRRRIKLLHGALTYRDARIAGFDAAALVEVIEHLDPPRLAAFERVVFEFARPTSVVLTTPNIEYNVRFPTLPAGRLRHRDHRFEWTRGEFQEWTAGIAQRFGYRATHLPIGSEDESVGAPTQMAILRRSK